MDRGIRLNARQKNLGLKDQEVQRDSGLSIDTIRKLGKVSMSAELLDSLEQGIEAARLAKISVLQAG